MFLTKRATARGVALLGASVLAVSLTACGAGAAADPNAKTVTILDSQTDAAGSKALQATIDQCTSTLKIQAKRRTVPFDQIIQQALLGASSKSLEDVGFFDIGNVAKVAQSGALVDLKSAGVTGAGIYPNVIDAGKYQGKSYVLATAAVSLAVFYNKDQFNAAGITAPPKNWDELRADAKKLTDSNHYGFAFSAKNDETGSFQFEPFFWSNGADLKKLNSTEGVEALQYWVDLVKDGSVSKAAVNWSQDDTLSQFEAGKTAMMFNGNWNIGSVQGTSGLNVGVFQLPTPHAGAATVNAFGGEGWALSTAGAKKPAAVSLVKCLTGEQAGNTWATQYNLAPAFPALAGQFAADKPLVAPFIDALKTAKARETGLNGRYAVISAALGTAIQSALNGSQTPQAALDQAQQTASK